MDVKQELRERRDELLSSLRTYLSTMIMVGDIDRFKDFIKYINRYTSSEVMFLIEREGLVSEVDAIIDKIEETQSSKESAKIE